jgi:hypothetical protein
MGEGPDRRAFDVVTAPLEADSVEFREVARAIAAVDTLESFLKDMRARYPEAAAPSTAGMPATIPPVSETSRTEPPAQPAAPAGPTASG